MNTWIFFVLDQYRIKHGTYVVRKYVRGINWSFANHDEILSTKNKFNSNSALTKMTLQNVPYNFTLCIFLLQLKNEAFIIIYYKIYIRILFLTIEHVSNVCRPRNNFTFHIFFYNFKTYRLKDLIHHLLDDSRILAGTEWKGSNAKSLDTLCNTLSIIRVVDTQFSVGAV